MKLVDTILPNILEEKLSALHEICQRYHIKCLWAFGSVLTDDFRPDSDIDFLYEWDRQAIPEGQYLPNQDGCIAALEKLFGRKIDFIHYPSMRNPYFIKDVEATKTLLYAQRPKEVSI